MAESKKRSPGRPKGSKNKSTSKAKSSGRTSEKALAEADLTRAEDIRKMQEQRRAHNKLMDEIWAVTIFALGIFLVITTQFNTTGAFGDAIHDILRGLFGIMTYVLPYIMMFFAVLVFMNKMQHVNPRTVSFSAVIYIMLCVLNSARYINPSRPDFSLDALGKYYNDSLHDRSAGVIGMEIGNILVKLIGMPGLYILALTLIFISILFVVNTPISTQLSSFKEKREEKKLLKEMEIRSRASDEDTLSDEELRKNFSAELSRYGGEGISDQRDYLSELLKDEKSRKKILEYMNDDSTVKDGEGLTSNTGKKGLVQGQGPAAGHGLGGVISSIAGSVKEKKTGLEGSSSSSSDNEEKAGVSSGLGLGGLKKADTKAKLTGLEPDQQSAPEVPAAPSPSVPEPEPEPAQIPAAAAAVSPVLKTKAEPATEADRKEIEKEIAAGQGKYAGYVLPPVDLLKKPVNSGVSASESDLQAKADQLETTLRNFNVDAHVINVTQGASVTRYEVQPAVGVKVSSIVKLSDDIALNMRAKSIRIEAPIPGKAAVGIEVENSNPAPVLVRELIDSEEFRRAKSKISFAVGKDISGNNIVADLKDMPHLLIAGATGSGKSVCINTMIASILYKATPDQVKLVLIDPKVVELEIYNDIPHMLIPVVTDPKKAAAALNWAVNEMNNRYHSFAEHRVRDLESYNKKLAEEGETDKILPQIVIIVDELADLMMTASNQVDEAIMRLAQKARAAGMHLVLATQRPSVDVVTGVIKANIPSRIALSVSSSFDSRTIIDIGGAEKLLGKGDMLFKPVNKNKPVRIQGPYISDKEISNLVEYVKEQGGGAEYNHKVIDTIESPESADNVQASDELTDEAIEFILHQKQASVSMLQRRFRIGYNRAARIIDEIEAMGIIGPSDGSRPRQVLMTEEEYARRESGDGEGQYAGSLTEEPEDPAEEEDIFTEKSDLEDGDQTRVSEETEDQNNE